MLLLLSLLLGLLLSCSTVSILLDGVDGLQYFRPFQKTWNKRDIKLGNELVVKEQKRLRQGVIMHSQPLLCFIRSFNGQ